MVASDHSDWPRVPFATTRWTIVLAAGGHSTTQSAAALAALCESYWYPLYAYARRHGHGTTQSEDLTQEFFTHLLDRHYLDRADPERGRFRTFLLTAFQRFLIDEYHREAAQKRGGARSIQSLNVDDAEARLAREPSHRWTAERAYEREWAIALLDRVLRLLEEEYSQRDKPQLFSQLKQFLSGEDPSDYRSLAQETGLTVGALRVTVHRLRQRYGELLRLEIGHTVANEQEWEDEYQALLQALRGE